MKPKWPGWRQNLLNSFESSTFKRMYRKQTLDWIDGHASYDNGYYQYSAAGVQIAVLSTKEDADFVTSEVSFGVGLTIKGIHKPLFDLDFQCSLLPSSNPNHYHLYLDKPITWRRYKKLLKAFFKAGLIDEGWYKNTLKNKAALLRTPSNHKIFIDTEEANTPLVTWL